MFKIEQISPLITLGMVDLHVFREIKRLSDKREIEQTGIRALIDEMLKEKDIQLEYDDCGKPFLTNRTENLSISHSYQWGLVVLNTKEATGVDIEKFKPKIEGIATRYLFDEEVKFYKGNIKAYTILWAAKEAIYKAYGRKRVEFKSQILVDRFEPKEEGLLKGALSISGLKKVYTLNYRCIKDYAIVWVNNEIR